MQNDKSTIKPVEKGNAQVINEITTAIHPFTLLRYEAIAEFYTQEPIRISIKVTENDDNINLEQIFRLRLWIPNSKIMSWSIYCNERELSECNNCGMVLRNVIWDKGFDTEKVRTASKEDKKVLLNSWPKIKIRNICLSNEDTISLIKEFSKMDYVISNGIKIEERKVDRDILEWSDIEVMRLFDWGKVHSIWSSTMGNEVIENQISCICKEFEKYLTFEMASIYELNLDYEYPTDDYKNLICNGK